MEQTPRKYGGFIKPEIKPEDYRVFGGQSPENVLQPNGQWLDFLPPNERQRNVYVEPCDCTAAGTHNGGVEILCRRIYPQDSKDFDASERFTASEAGIRPPGADPKVAADFIRHKGVIPENMLPLTDDIRTLDQFYAGVTDEMRAVGAKWVAHNDFQYSWVAAGITDNAEYVRRIKYSLTLSPVCFAIDAWKEVNGLYVNEGEPNHWTTIVGYVENQYWIIFDTYSPFLKKMKWDINFTQSYAMRYHLARKSPQDQLNSVAESIISKPRRSFIEWLVDLFNDLLVTNKNINEASKPKVEEAKPQPTPEEVKKFEEVYPKYEWDTPAKARHSLRVICDEMGVSYTLKNIISQVVNAESGYNIKAKNENRKNGVVWSTDWGICQINDHFWIGPGKYFASVDEVLNNPEKSVRWMIKQAKMGNLKYWSAFNNDSYKKYPA